MNDQANLKTKSAVPYSDEMPIAPRPTPWHELPVLGRLRDWAGAEDGGIEDPEVQEKYRQAFLWFDHEDPDIFGSYKLPIADVVEGVLTIIPRAVFAAAARLNGGRGGVYFYFPEDRPRVMRTIEKYYEKMELISPFGKSFRIDDFKAHDPRILEKLFRSGVSVSRKMSMVLVSSLKSEFLRQDNDKEKEGEGNQREVDTKKSTDWSGVLKKINDIKLM